MESWLQGMAITHQRPGQPPPLCALHSPPVPGHRPSALDYPPPSPWPTAPQEQGWESCVGKELLQARCGEGVTRAGFLEEGRWLRGENMEWVSVDQGVSAGGGRGRTSKVSIQPPDRESWRGPGRGLLPAMRAILGPESNQIRQQPPEPPAAAQNSCPR